jgi:hypothetical protein
MNIGWGAEGLRFCLPRVRRRGYGLGNEFLPWARAFLASQVLGARLLPPAFGLNRRAYWWHFRTAPDDWIHHRALLRLLPVVEFSEAQYLEHGGGDVVTALERFAVSHGLHERRAYVLVTEGLWGGYHHVRAAREFIRATLYASRYAAGNLLRLAARLDARKLVVGMHVRLGDFAAAGSRADYRGTSNISLPLEWLCALAQSLDAALGDQWQLLLVTDGSPQQLAPLIGRWACTTTADLPPGDCSDLLALAAADLLICSVSSFSTLAAFLSDAPYVCFAPSLHAHPEGVFSLGVYDPDRDARANPVREALGHWRQARADLRPRGVGVDLDGKIPGTVIEAALRRQRSRCGWP